MSKQAIAEEIVSELRHFAKLYSLESLFVVGGYCRAKILNDYEDLEDIDIAAAYPHQALRLCGLFASEVLHTTPTFYHRTGVGSIQYKGLRLEFQNESINSYMHNEDVKLWMRKNAIRNTPLLNNIYGRDLTINSLILSIKNGELYDLTGKAIEDLERKQIRSILPAQLIMKYNPLVILRSIRFACRYNFHIVPELRKEIRDKKEVLKKAYSQERLVKEVEKILRSDTKRAKEELQRYDLLSLVLPEQVEKYFKDDTDERD